MMLYLQAKSVMKLIKIVVTKRLFFFKEMWYEADAILNHKDITVPASFETPAANSVVSTVFYSRV